MSQLHYSFSASSRNSATNQGVSGASSNPNSAASSTCLGTRSQINSRTKYFERLSTYKRWPNSAHLRPTKLAAGGFNYTGFKDETECPTCWLKHANWQVGDNPLAFHIKEQKECALAKFIKTDVECDGGDPEMRADVPEVIEREIETDHQEEARYGEIDLVISSAHRSVKRARSRPSTREDLERMKAENNKLQKQFSCWQCGKNKINLLFLPCRHLVACEECGNAVTDCCFCSMKILGTVKTFLV